MSMLAHKPKAKIHTHKLHVKQWRNLSTFWWLSEPTLLLLSVWTLQRRRRAAGTQWSYETETHHQQMHVLHPISAGISRGTTLITTATRTSPTGRELGGYDKQEPQKYLKCSQAVLCSRDNVCRIQHSCQEVFISAPLTQWPACNTFQTKFKAMKYFICMTKPVFHDTRPFPMAFRFLN